MTISSGYIWYDNGWHNERPEPINKGRQYTGPF